MCTSTRASQRRGRQGAGTTTAVILLDKLQKAAPTHRPQHMPPKSSSAGASGSAKPKASAGGGSGGATRSAKANAGGGGASDDVASGTKPRKGGSLRGVKNWVFRSTKPAAGSKAGKGAASSAARTSRQTFQDLDVDGSGFLSIDELKGLLASPGGGHALSDADIAEIVAEFGA